MLLVMKEVDMESDYDDIAPECLSGEIQRLELEDSFRGRKAGAGVGLRAG